MLYIPDNVMTIINKIEENGFEAYAVGGCVRDSLLDITPHDWDICTSAFPPQTKEIFSGLRTVDTGMRHGTISVILGGESYEITTYRHDGEYADNRHPTSVEFVRRIDDDLSRRDFTVNAMAYNPKRGIVDLFGGRQDINDKIIRCVGDPDTRFLEDALRIMRALRFACVYGFEIDENTAGAALRNKDLLKNISAERICTELCKLLTGKGLRYILENFYDIFTVFLPDFDIDAVCTAENNLYIRLAAITGDVSVLKALKLDNNTIRIVSALRSDAVPSRDTATLNRIINKIGFDECRLLIQFKKQYELLPILDNMTVYSLKNLAINGSDIINLGIPAGKRTGEILNSLLDKVIDGEIPNDKQKLLNFVLTLL